MEGAHVAERMLRDHAEMRIRLADWEAALAQVTATAFAESKRGVERLRQLVPFFDGEVHRHFREEEAHLHPIVSAQHCGAEPALARFAGEHREFFEQWQTFKSELQYCDAVGEPRGVYELGTALIRLLRQHMESEERELVPLVAQR